jgi:hypothetical protein
MWRHGEHQACEHFLVVFSKNKETPLLFEKRSKNYFLLDCGLAGSEALLWVNIRAAWYDRRIAVPDYAVVWLVCGASRPATSASKDHTRAASRDVSGSFRRRSISWSLKSNSAAVIGPGFLRSSSSRIMLNNVATLRRVHGESRKMRRTHGLCGRDRFPPAAALTYDLPAIDSMINGLPRGGDGGRRHECVTV